MSVTCTSPNIQVRSLSNIKDLTIPLVKSKELTANPEKTLEINSRPEFVQKPSETVFDKETILLLNEVEDLQESTKTLLSDELDIDSVKHVKTDNIEPDSVPRLSWLIGRDNYLFYSYQEGLITGNASMKNLSEIMEKYGNSSVLSAKDYDSIKRSITRFESGVNNRTKYRTTCTDPVVLKVIDYIMPKSQKRLELLQTYLADKTRAPEETLDFGYIDTPDNSTIPKLDEKLSSDKSNQLLNKLLFLEEDLF